MRVAAIVFDVSGVLRDSRVLTHKCFRESFAALAPHVAVPGEADLWRLRGVNANLRWAVEVLCAGADVRSALQQPLAACRAALDDAVAREAPSAALVSELRKDMRARFSDPSNKALVSLCPGVVDGLPRLAREYRTTVVSNSTRKSLDRDLPPELQRALTIPPIDEANKPDTARYLEALKGLGLQPGQVAYVGDAVSDVVMARRAGSVAIALTTGMGSPAHLAEARPDYQFDSFAELVHAAMTGPGIEAKSAGAKL